MTRSWRRSMVWVAGASLLALGGAAFGQNALGDGRVLDNNLRQGSGGVNTRVRSVEAQIRFNNAIVTGNAGFGRSFRGDVGYLASNDFRASLGSNDLYNFRRDSTASAITGSGIRGTDALQYQVSLATGQTVPSFLDRPISNAGVVQRSGASFSGSAGVAPAPINGGFLDEPTAPIECARNGTAR